MKRRSFLNWAGIGLLASYFPVALAACSQADSDATSQDTTPPHNQTKDNFLVLGTTAELQSASYLLNEELEVIVIQDSEQQLFALNPTCTHQGCIVDYDRETNTLVCPCHYAKYSLEGNVLAKPAPKPLSVYEVKSDNGEILVKVT